jgi:hypothetical protein
MTKAMSTSMTARNILVEAVPDPETNEDHKQTVRDVAASLHAAAPKIGNCTRDFWQNAGTLAAALHAKLAASPLPAGMVIDEGTIRLHAVHPDNPRVYLPSTDGSLPTIQLPMTWDAATPNSRHFIQLRFEGDA